MSNNTKPLPSVDEIMDLIGVLQTYPRANDSEASVRAALTQLHTAAVSGLANIERPKRLGVYARVVHELIHPDNGYCNQCGGHWLYRTDGTWEYTDGEHTEACVLRRHVGLLTPEPHERFVRCTPEFVEQLRAYPSRPVTIEIHEREGGELFFVAIEHVCNAVPSLAIRREDVP